MKYWRPALFTMLAGLLAFGLAIAAGPRPAVAALVAAVSVAFAGIVWRALR